MSRRGNMAKRKREIVLRFRVTPEERGMIEEKMAQLGTENMAAYLRKMAIDGYVVKLDLPELRDMVSLLKRSSSNLNQIAKRVNETSRITPRISNAYSRIRKGCGPWRRRYWEDCRTCDNGIGTRRERR